MHTHTITVAGKTIEVDEGGYLHYQNRNDWSEEVAKEMARLDGVELTPAHWEIINFMRDYFEEYQTAPSWRMLPKAIGKKLGTDKGNNKYLYELFPYGPVKQACKYAGLPWPNPGCC